MLRRPLEATEVMGGRAAAPRAETGIEAGTGVETMATIEIAHVKVVMSEGGDGVAVTAPAEDAPHPGSY